MPSTPNPLREVAKGVQGKLMAALAQSKPIDHAVTKGEKTERTWISLFRKYLPKRFRTERGIIIDCNGQTSDQIDCVVFDAQFTPQIDPGKAGLHIPAEAVHAVFEVRQTVNRDNLQYSARKVKSVRDLHRTSMPYTGDGQPRAAKPHFHIIGGLLATSSEYKDKLASATFLDNLGEVGRIARLDFVFSAEDGYVDLVKTNKIGQVRNDGKPFLVEGEVGISYGLFRLLEELSWQGTVPLVDWSKYFANLADPGTIEIPDSPSVQKE